LDRQFLETFKNSFFDVSLSSEAFLFLIGLLFFLVVASTAGILFNKLFRHRKSPFPSNWIVDSKRIRKILENALGERSKLELRFSRDDLTGGRFISGTLSEIGSHTISMELSDLVDVSNAWIGRKLETFFKVSSSKKKDTSTGKKDANFFTFTSEILEVKKTSKEYVAVTITFPPSLEMKQKRTHLRLDPPSRFIYGLRVWPEQRTSSGKVNSNISTWKEPLLELTPDVNDKIILQNISAGGLRLEIQPDWQKEGTDIFELGKRFMICLDLFNPTANNADRHYLYTTVRNRFEDFTTRRLEVGLKFLASGFPSISNPDELRWIVTKDDGVEAIDNWVFRRHLELYRNTGLG
jgi:hypothetical protein